MLFPIFRDPLVQLVQQDLREKEEFLDSQVLRESLVHLVRQEKQWVRHCLIWDGHQFIEQKEGIER